MLPVSGGIITGIFKALWTAIKSIAEVIAKVLWYTGLFVPVLYAAFGGVLYLVANFNPFAEGTYPLLYRIGFYLSVVVAIIIVYRRITKSRREKKKARLKEEAEREREEELLRRKEERAKRRLDAKKDNEYRARYRKKVREDRRATRKNRSVKDARSDITEEEDYEFPEAVRLSERGRKEYEKQYDPDVIYNTRYGRLDTQNAQYEYRNDRMYENNDYRSSRPTQREEPKIYMSSVEPDTLIHEYSDRFEVYRLTGGKKTLDKVEYKNNG